MAVSKGLSVRLCPFSCSMRPTHSPAHPPSLMPFSAQSILDRVLEGWPEPGPKGNLGEGR